MLKIKVEVILQSDREKGYEDLSDLIFASLEHWVSHNRVEVFVITFKDMEHETLQRMLSVKGLVNWNLGSCPIIFLPGLVVTNDRSLSTQSLHRILQNANLIR